MCFNQTGNISTINSSTLKLVDKFTYVGSSVSSTETDINTRLAEHGQLTIIFRSCGSQIWPIKWNAVSSKQRSCRYCYMDTPDGYWLNDWRKSLLSITQECCEQYWTSPGDNNPQSSSYTTTEHPSRKLSKLDRQGTAKAGRSVRICIQHLCADTRGSPEDMPKTMDNTEVCRETVRNIRVDSVTWLWWWYICISTVAGCGIKFIFKQTLAEFSFLVDQLLYLGWERLFAQISRENNWIHTFLKGFSAM